MMPSGPSHALLLGATDKGCANIVYRLVPEPARIPAYPERPHSDCYGQFAIEYDNGILACGGGSTRTCHHYRFAGGAPISGWIANFQLFRLEIRC